MQKTLDTEYRYRNGSNLRLSACRIRVYEDVDEQGNPADPDNRSIRTVAVATMRMDRPEEGSIVNDAEGLAAEIREVQAVRYRRGFPRRETAVTVGEFVWVQHVVERPDGCFPDSYDLVDFDESGGVLSNPRWRQATKEDIERLVGQPLG